MRGASAELFRAFSYFGNRYNVGKKTKQKKLKTAKKQIGGMTKNYATLTSQNKKESKEEN